MIIETTRGLINPGSSGNHCTDLLKYLKTSSASTLSSSFKQLASIIESIKPDQPLIRINDGSVSANVVITLSTITNPFSSFNTAKSSSVFLKERLRKALADT